jgi:hypothetical protein
MRLFCLHKNSTGEKLPVFEKRKALIQDGAIETDEKFKPELVCIIEGFLLDLCAYVATTEQFDYLRSDGRRKHWLIYNHAKKISGY